jgi:signal transduction histidine kinase
VGLALARSRLAESEGETGEMLELAAEELASALQELRELAQGIHPAVLTDRGLAVALEVLAARTPLPVALEVLLDERLPEPLEAAAYYVVSESLANVVKHAAAETARVRVERGPKTLTVEIGDDGVGGARLAGGSGLRGLQDRVETLDGTLTVTSERGRGTVVHAELPLSVVARGREDER